MSQFLVLLLLLIFCWSFNSCHTKYFIYLFKLISEEEKDL